MERSLFLSNAVFVVQWLSGFVGEIRIFVTAAIKSKYQESTYREHLSKNYQNVKANKNVQSVENMVETVMNIV
jgi:hypothetical protein